MATTQFGIGQSVRRIEDLRFLTGQGRFVDDFDLANQLFAQVVRSPHAHAEIRSVDTADAAALPGVIAVLTGADYAADDLGNIPAGATVQGRDGKESFVPPRPALAQGRVRHAGEPVAFVVAQTLAIARDAAELVIVDYADLPTVVATDRATANDAYQIYGRSASEHFLRVGER